MTRFPYVIALLFITTLTIVGIIALEVFGSKDSNIATIGTILGLIVPIVTALLLLMKQGDMEETQQKHAKILETGAKEITETKGTVDELRSALIASVEKATREREQLALERGRRMGREEGRVEGKEIVDAVVRESQDPTSPLIVVKE